MKKFIAGAATLIAVLTVSHQSMADLEWGSTFNLQTWDATIQAGWLVQMYRDVDANTTLGSVVNFGEDGSPIGGNSDDDVLLGTFTGLTVDSKGSMIWGESFPEAQWSTHFGHSVYSVLYNASNIGDASQAVIFDDSPFVLPGSDPATYTLGSVDNDWVSVIPEPSTMALLGMGVLGLLGLRRRMIK